VIVNYLRDETAARHTAELIIETEGTASCQQADMRNPEVVVHMMENGQEVYGPIEGLVNNAGGLIGSKPLTEMAWEDMESQLSTHLKGRFLCARALWGSVWLAATDRL
jgi:NAD(P)-dependent dehydrogenase (short-subunit alcohol dehydrogenase family)